MGTGEKDKTYQSWISYAARESAKYQNQETMYRSLELEFASLNPFIEFLPEDKKKKIKEELV